MSSNKEKLVTMKRDLTLAIPTHKRHHFLDRLLPTLLCFEVPILIMDSSDAPYLGAENTPSIQYIHCPGMGFQEKLRTFIPEHVSTQYMMLNADDIFPLKTTVFKAYDFLCANPDYSTAHGLTFWYQNRRIHQHRIDCELYQADSPSPSTRLLQHHVYDFHTFYAVQRTDCWKAVLEASPITSLSPTLYEIYQIMASVIHGKAKRLDDIHHVIDCIPSVDSHEGGMPPAFKDPQYAPQVELLKQTLSRSLQKVEPMATRAARKYLDSALSLVGLLHVDRSLYYWCDAYIEPKKAKTVADRIANEWQHFLGKTFCKKQKSERKAAQKRREDEQIAAHVAQVLAASSPEIRQEFEAIRNILEKA